MADTGFTYYRCGNVAVRSTTAAGVLDVEVYSWDKGAWVDSGYHWDYLSGANGDACAAYEEITEAEAQAIIDGGDPDAD